MRLFVSYARVDKPSCIQVVDTLDVHETWYDQRLYAGQDWWKEILQRLDWCEGFIYLLSPDSVNSEVCRKEYELAKSLGRHIFPAIVRENTPIPESLTGVHYVDLSSGIDSDGVKMLLNSIYIAERHQMQHSRSVSSIPADETKQPTVNPATVIRSAATAMENGQYDQVVFLLKQAKANGYESRYINIDAILKEAEVALERQTYLLEAEREYRPIVELIQHSHANTRKVGLDAFEAFRRDFPDYDPENLARFCPPPKPVYLLPQSINHSDEYFEYPASNLPMMEWCGIPAGTVELVYGDEGGHQTMMEIDVDPFRMARYPITNAQYQVFIDDENGYCNPGWWHFSSEAYHWRMKNPVSLQSQFKGDERPREMVSWYDGLAFCNWLSSYLGVRIALPTIAQWQRAMQGNDGRIYPWGNLFDSNLCNTAESDIKMTTQVTRYMEAASPFGVVDMVGNIWEWCIDTRPNLTKSWNIADRQKRVIRGGSYMSSQTRVDPYCYYDLDPKAYHASIGFRIVQNY